MTTETRAARLARWRAANELHNAQMAARLRQCAASRAQRQPLSFGDALGQLYLQNAYAFGLTLGEAYDGLTRLAVHIPPEEH